ncbi:cell envelope integrity protein TolA [Paracoccus ravus]|uniref:cell envelope integrity protein TolA n=1 Tax=Paracoccus ravus TaxID=2447760 RepID=UPI00106E07E6|nr:cell envelope integrity protein TolA [Paracoccus ravus]
MDRADRFGYWVSGAAHAGLIGFAVVGGALFRPQPLDAIRMAEVSTMSEAEFQALAAAAAGSGPVDATAETVPAQPRPPADEVVIGAPEAMSPPAPDSNVAMLNLPAARPEERPDLPETPRMELPATTAAPEAERQAPAPLPQESKVAALDAPRPHGRPEGLAQAVQARREAEEAARRREAVLAREAEEAAAEEAAAKERSEAAARRQAEERAEAERRETARREEAQAARKAAEAEERARRLAAAEAAEAEKREAAEAAKKEAAERAAREAAAEKRDAEKREAEAKAREEAEEKAAAEKAAEEKRAAAKKAAQEAAAEAKAKEKAEAERKAANEAAKKAALAEAMKKEEGAGASGGGGAAASGPPLSQGEKDGFRVAVEACWNRGSLSTEAGRTTVSVSFSMSPDGKPESGSLKMIDHNGASDAVAKQAYEAARRAILMCGRNGYNLPAEKYNRWKDVIIDFNPSGNATIK